jgi:HPt (histidine-containing phosphotransfer) domain-containing protein
MRPRLFWGYLSAQILAIASFALLPAGSLVHMVWQVGVGWTSAMMAVVGVRRLRPVHPTSWYLFAAGVFLNATGILVAHLLERFKLNVVPPTLADLFWLCLFPGLGVGLALLVRQRRTGPDWSTLVDTTIIITGISLLSWVFLIHPQASDTTLTVFARAVVCAYPIGDLVILAMMVRLLLSGGNSNTSFRLLMGALFCFLCSDIGWAALSQLGINPGPALQRALESGSLSAFTLVGAAAVHPSMVDLARPVAARPIGLSKRLLGGLTVASLIAPGVLAVQVFHRRIVDGAAVALSSTVLFLLVVTRLAQLLRRVEEQSRALGERNRAVRLVLDTINDGLLRVSSDGRLAEERSATIDRWFGPVPGQVPFVDYIRPHDDSFAGWFGMAHQALLEGILPEEVNLAQFPARLRTRTREFRVSYLPIRDGSAPEGALLLVINDCTDQLAMEQHEAEQRELLTLFQRSSRDRSGLLTFLDEAGQLVAQITSGALDRVTQRRLIHTLKGNAGLMGLTVMAALCHQAEDELDSPTTTTVLTPAVLALGRRFATLTESWKAMAGDQARPTPGPAAEDLEDLCADIGRGLPADQIVQRLSAWRCEPVEMPLRRLAEHARALAGRLGKGEITVEASGRGLWLDPARWAPLWSEMVHVMNNAVDHGMESPERRRAAGKLTPPRLRLSAQTLEHELLIEVEDDGPGIDWPTVQRLARDRGWPAADPTDWTRALLSPGFSTRGEVSETSGRGYGLASVSARVKQMQGQISVSSREGRGTCWRLSFPRSILRSYETAAPAVSPAGLSPAVGSA